MLNYEKQAVGQGAAGLLSALCLAHNRLGNPEANSNHPRVYLLDVYGLAL